MSETDISQPETTIKRGSLPRPSERTWFLSGQTDTTEPTRQYEITGDEFVIGRGRDSDCLLYTSPSPRDATLSRMPSSP